MGASCRLSYLRYYLLRNPKKLPGSPQNKNLYKKFYKIIHCEVIPTFFSWLLECTFKVSLVLGFSFLFPWQQQSTIMLGPCSASGKNLLTSLVKIILEKEAARLLSSLLNIICYQCCWQIFLLHGPGISVQLNVSK